MAHYAMISSKNKVVNVISGRDETDIENLPSGFDDWEDYYENFTGLKVRRCSYNTYANQHHNEGTAFRGNYPSIGYIWDEENDVFYAQQPYSSWTLNTDTWLWNSPVEYPDDNEQYHWDEETQTWELS
tara:strand:+ start:314 stop:697 length:384 start_codon:yes stop_codon:yes gene_type:complete